MIRTQVRRKLTDLIAADPLCAAADVTAVYPGDKFATREMVFCDRTIGGVTFPYAMAEPRMQRDRFSCVVVVRISATENLDAAMDRCQEIASAVVAILGADTLLGFEAAGEKVTDTNPDGESIGVETREGESKTGVPLALAEITVPFETQTTNTED